MSNKINNTGYLEGAPTEKNNYNIIPNNKITMKDVKKNLMAIKLDKKGKPIGIEFMDPGKDYEFDKTYAVLEVPKYQAGVQHGSQQEEEYEWEGKPLDPNWKAPFMPFASTPEIKKAYNDWYQANKLKKYNIKDKDSTTTGYHKMPDGTMMKDDEMYQGGGSMYTPGDQSIHLPDKPNYDLEQQLDLIDKYAKQKLLSREQVGGFEDQRGTDRQFFADRDTFMADYSKKWTATGKNKNFSQVSPEREQMRKDAFKAWDKYNTRNINPTVQDYAQNGPQGTGQGAQFMIPDKDYGSDDTYAMLEVPKYQGGAQYGPQQEEEYKPMYPYTEGANIPKPQQQQYGPQQSSPQQGYQQLYPNTEGMNFTPTEEELDMMDLNNETADVNQFNQSFVPNKPNEAPNFDMNQAISKAENALGESSNNELAPYQQDNFPNIQFFNPYGGIDMPTAATTLGQSIANKDTLGTVLSATKFGLAGARNVFGGMGSQNRKNQTMKDYYKKLREDGNVTALEDGGEFNILDMFKTGGMKDEEFLTGEFITGMEEYHKMYDQANAEIEKGEYYSTVDGDIAEVVGSSHGRDGGEKVIMEKGDRILTDHTKLGAKNAKYVRDNYDLNIKAKNTYADVLDKFRNKSGFGKLVQEEEGLLKKLKDQEDIKDDSTKDLNTKFLQKKLEEITAKKSPIEEARKFLYDELFELQEKDKPAEERANFQDGGGLSQYQPGGGDGKTAAKVDVREGQSLTMEGFFGNVNSEEYKKFVAENRQWFDFSNFDPTKRGDVTRLQEAYNLKARATGGNLVRVDGKFGEQTSSMVMGLNASPWAGLKNQEIGMTGPEVSLTEQQILGNSKPKTIEEQVAEIDSLYDNEEDKRKALNALLLPDQYPMVPEGTQPVLKNTRRYDRVEAAQIDPEAYLQTLYDQSGAAQSRTEGLPDAVRNASNANIDANTQKALAAAMLQIDEGNIKSKNNAEVINARTQMREEDARVMDNLSFEKRQLTADAKTDLAFQNYFDKNQEVNLGNFNTVNAINNANARYDNIQFDGNGYIVRDKPNFNNTLSGVTAGTRTFGNSNYSDKEIEEALRLYENNKKTS